MPYFVYSLKVFCLCLLGLGGLFVRLFALLQLRRPTLQQTSCIHQLSLSDWVDLPSQVPSGLKSFFMSLDIIQTQFELHHSNLKAFYIWCQHLLCPGSLTPLPSSSKILENIVLALTALCPDSLLCDDCPVVFSHLALTSSSHCTHSALPTVAPQCYNLCCSMWHPSDFSQSTTPPRGQEPHSGIPCITDQGNATPFSVCQVGCS